VARATTPTLDAQAAAEALDAENSSGLVHFTSQLELPLHFRLTAFFHLFNQNQLPVNPQLVRRFTGEDELLNQALLEEYGADLSCLSAALTLDLALSRLPIRERLALFYLLYCPRKVGRVGRVANMYTANETELNRGE
jgi:hypothetical protein